MKHVTRSCACLCLAVLILFSLMPVASQAAEAEATQAAAVTPPLPEAPEEDTAAGAGFSDGLTGAIQGQPDYEIRFFFLDWLGKIENFLFSS